MASILILEDDQSLGELLSQVLQDDGYQTQLVSSLEAARALVQSQAVDLVVADLVEADTIGGDRVVQQLAALAAGRPLLLCTGQPRAPRFASTPGVFTVIEKPFDLDDLLARIGAARESVH